MIKEKSRVQFLEKGYIVLKSVFSKEYISEVRNKMITLSSRDRSLDLSEFEVLLNEDMQKMLLNEKLIQNIKEILATKNLLYYSDSGIMIRYNPTEIFDRYHNDARGEDINVSNQEEYPIVRLGIYFHDTKKFSGGIKIREKSHKYILFKKGYKDILKAIKLLLFNKFYSLNSLKLGKGINIETEEGDVVIWNLRTHHAGMSRRLKLFPNYVYGPCLIDCYQVIFFYHFNIKMKELHFFARLQKMI
tara:strand:+ start:2365 stop:3102 length:738 start_codon:yes stop_codon:yes gene_type:complete